MNDATKTEDGGPAFSGGLFEPQHGGTNDREPWNAGMSLRDWFAGQALAGFVVRQSAAFSDAETGAKFAYRYADAMIAARSTPPKQGERV